MNVSLVSKVMQLVFDIAICQIQKGVFVEKGFLQGVTGQHQLLKPMGGCDALPFFPLAAELLMVLLCWLAFATAVTLLAVWGRGPLSERLPQLVFFIIMVLVGLVVQQLPASQNFTGWLCNINSQHKLVKKTAFAASSNCRKNLQQ